MENNPLISHSIDDNDNEPLHPSEELRESTHIQIKLNSPLKNNDSLNSITNEREENEFAITMYLITENLLPANAVLDCK